MAIVKEERMAEGDGNMTEREAAILRNYDELLLWVAARFAEEGPAMQGAIISAMYRWLHKYGDDSA